MCGIVGVTGRADALDLIMSGLKRLEYRGYDSAGIVIGDDLRVVKRGGKLDNLAAALEGQGLGGTTGVGHTRWATHGPPTDRNAHPHTDADGTIAVVHNGIIENYEQLRATLPDADYSSDTDTEVVAHLIAARVAEGTSLPDASRAVVQQLQGAFALCIVHSGTPDMIVVAKREAPLIVGHADGVGYCASDVAPMIAHTRDVSALLDDQVAVITPEGIEVTDLAGEPAEAHDYHVDWDLDAAEKGGFDHFMLKEIHEQPQAIADTLRDRLGDPGASTGGPSGGQRLHLDECRIDEQEFGRIDKVFIVACGTSLYSAMVGKLAIEHWAGVPVEVEVASEFRYRDPILDPHTLVIAVSQSGETTDTMAAAAHARDQRAPVLSLVNVVGSTLAREADAVFYTHAGPEVAVASTKAFTSQLAAFLVIGLYLAQQKGRIYTSEIRDILTRLHHVAGQVQEVLDQDHGIAELAEKYADAHYTMFIGRHSGLPIAMEGALKLKEISYLHAEAFPAGEMKHGPIALIEEGSLVVALAPAGHTFAKMVSNIQEVKARGAAVLAIGTDGSVADLKAHADDILTLPEAAHELATPILAAIPLQLFAYHVARLRGEDIDQPRNLAKTVTVE
jgi:glucosamine--fructose-6-phosphate aminotransferase (isomerizing)